MWINLETIEETSGGGVGGSDDLWEGFSTVQKKEVTQG